VSENVTKQTKNSPYSTPNSKIRLSKTLLSNKIRLDILQKKTLNFFKNALSILVIISGNPLISA